MTKVLDRKALISEFADQQVNRMSREMLEQYAYDRMCDDLHQKTDVEIIDLVDELNPALLGEFLK